MKTNCIIICAGNQTRWSNYLGTSKHLIDIDGERLIDRTVRLIKKNFDNVLINIVALSDEYASKDANLFIPELNPNNLGLDKFLSSKELWKTEQRNIIFYGDVYYTDNAMKIISIAEKLDWYLFARFNESNLYQKGGECFAFSFYPAHFNLFESKM